MWSPSELQRYTSRRELITNFHQNCGRFSDITERCMYVITLPNPIEMCYLFDFP